MKKMFTWVIFENWQCSSVHKVHISQHCCFGTGAVCPTLLPHENIDIVGTAKSQKYFCLKPRILKFLFSTKSGNSGNSVLRQCTNSGSPAWKSDVLHVHPTTLHTFRADNAWKELVCLTTLEGISVNSCFLNRVKGSHIFEQSLLESIHSVALGCKHKNCI